MSSAVRLRMRSDSDVMRSMMTVCKQRIHAGNWFVADMHLMRSNLIYTAI